jgi:hypothetical protein
VKKYPRQEWFPTQYWVTKEERGYIMEALDDDWMIPMIET